MAREPKFAATVIIPTYNRRGMLHQNLESLKASSISKNDFEIIVVDDGSSDDTFELIRGFKDSCQIRYVYQEDRGYRLSRARNQGIDLAEGAVCIFLDCGVVVSSGFVQAHVDAHARPNKYVFGYVYGFSNNDDNDEALNDALSTLDLADVDSMIAKFKKSGQFPDLREGIYASVNDDVSALPAPWCIAWGANLSVRRETLGNRFRFDETYQTWGAEDIDFALALFENGTELAACRAASGIHVPHPKSHVVNSTSSRPNKIRLHAKYNRPETELLIDIQSWDLNAYLMRQAANVA
ncbi:glycosyltransferase [Mesorhizobium sp. NPDC059054]|uniref:glycosyltransferase n=1 Tax=Mesorhizobium sp. NPDC059054 TaxID=3346711 RepID=UPI0036AD6591